LEAVLIRARRVLLVLRVILTRLSVRTARLVDTMKACVTSAPGL